PNVAAPRSFRVTTNSALWQGKVDEEGTSKQVSVCVPARRFADVRIDAPHYSPIYGDPKTEASFGSYARSGGVLVTGIALADETEACGAATGPRGEAPHGPLLATASSVPRRLRRARRQSRSRGSRPAP